MTDNITALRPKPKDATGTLRAKRFRGKQKERPPVTVAVPTVQVGQREKRNGIKGDVTVARHGGHAIDVAAVALAGAAAGFSIRGMTVLFPGAPTSIIGMGGRDGRVEAHHRGMACPGGGARPHGCGAGSWSPWSEASRSSTPPAPCRFDRASLLEGNACP
jgi:hypothetical protein